MDAPPNVSLFPAEANRESPSPLMPPLRGWCRRGLQFASLSGLIWGQQLLDRLQHNPGYLVQEQMGRADLVLIAVALLFGPACLMLMLEQTVQWLRPTWLPTIHHWLIAGLIALLFLAPIDRTLGGLRWIGVPTGALAIVGGVALGLLLARSYRRRGWGESIVDLAMIGLVVFPVRFFTSPQISAVFFPPQRTVVALPVEHPAPVVMVIFDGLCGMSLLNEQHEIDAVRYPNFARLARNSTWHQNTTTVHYRTDNAVPAILTGRIPNSKQLPVQADHPINLFSILESTEQYELVLFEPFTRLSPKRTAHLLNARPLLVRVGSTLNTLALVWLEINVPIDVPFPHIPVPRNWFRISSLRDNSRDLRTGNIGYPWDSYRHTQVDHFVDCLTPRDRPACYFLHLVMPHYPWIYLPDGRRYQLSGSASDYPLGCHGDFGEDWGSDEQACRTGWQRYLFQVQAADHALGRILDQLQAEDLFDDSLIVVLADHGEAFLPNRSRREPDAETLPFVASVPLFIKAPHQQMGTRTDHNVETIDVLPTIADILGVELPHAVDGVSLVDEREVPRSGKTLVLPNGRFGFDGEFPERFRYVSQMMERFGSGDDPRLRESGWHDELVGRKVAEFSIGPASRFPVTLILGGSQVNPEKSEYVPCYFEGLVSHVEEGQSVTLAIEVNGVVSAVTRTLTDPALIGFFGVLVNEDRFHPGSNPVRLYEVEFREDGPQLRPCRLMED